MSTEHEISPTLEDYLETIYLLVSEKKVARVKDIAEARGVKPGSVSPAMKRLAKMGLINYRQREFIDLTPEGETIARRTLARHELLMRFFREVLGLSAKNARADACSMEHYLSDEGVDRLTRFFEFIQRCPAGQKEFLSRLHACPIVNPGMPECPHECNLLPGEEGADGRGRGKPRRSVRDLESGQAGFVALVDASGDMRKLLLDRGLLPGTRVEMRSRHHETGEVSVLVRGQETVLSEEQASHVLVTA